jgi:hypothetical protein
MHCVETTERFAVRTAIHRLLKLLKRAGIGIGKLVRTRDSAFRTSSNSRTSLLCRVSAIIFGNRSIHPQAGIHFRNRFFIIDGSVIDKEVFGGRHTQDEWRLDSVAQDGNLIYLQLSTGNDENPETRLVGVPFKVSKIIMDQLEMQALYLISDRFDSKEAAVSRARELDKLAKERKFFEFNAEVWSTRLPTDKMTWLVVAANSDELVRGGSVRKLEDGLGVDFEPVSSERFEEKVSLKIEDGDRCSPLQVH